MTGWLFCLQFFDDVEYLLDGLKASRSISTRCLSALDFAAQCCQASFRVSLRAHGVSPKIFAALEDAPSDKVRVFNWYKKNGLVGFINFNTLFLSQFTVLRWNNYWWSALAPLGYFLFSSTSAITLQKIAGGFQRIFGGFNWWQLLAVLVFVLVSPWTAINCSSFNYM